MVLVTNIPTYPQINHCLSFFFSVVLHIFFVRRHKDSFLPPNLFRPVIATFTATGIGKDTSDVSYKSRGVGLYNNKQ